jgi:hypothetical protein
MSQSLKTYSVMRDLGCKFMALSFSIKAANLSPSQDGIEIRT